MVWNCYKTIKDLKNTWSKCQKYEKSTGFSSFEFKSIFFCRFLKILRGRVSVCPYVLKALDWSYCILTGGSRLSPQNSGLLPSSFTRKKKFVMPLLMLSYRSPRQKGAHMSNCMCSQTSMCAHMCSYLEGSQLVPNKTPPAWRIGLDPISPALPYCCCRNIAGHCWPMPDGRSYYCYY